MITLRNHFCLWSGGPGAPSMAGRGKRWSAPPAVAAEWAPWSISDFVRWNSAFHHVLVFTVKRRCVLFIYITEYTSQIEIFLCKNIFPFPARNYKAQFCLEIKIYSVWIFVLNNSAIWLVNTKPQNTQMHCGISPRRTCKPSGNTMKIS